MNNFQLTQNQETEQIEEHLIANYLKNVALKGKQNVQYYGVLKHKANDEQSKDRYDNLKLIYDSWETFSKNVIISQIKENNNNRNDRLNEEDQKILNNYENYFLTKCFWELMAEDYGQNSIDTIKESLKNINEKPNDFDGIIGNEENAKTIQQMQCEFNTLQEIYGIKKKQIQGNVNKVYFLLQDGASQSGHYRTGIYDVSGNAFVIADSLKRGNNHPNLEKYVKEELTGIIPEDKLNNINITYENRVMQSVKVVKGSNELIKSILADFTEPDIKQIIGEQLAVSNDCGLCVIKNIENDINKKTVKETQLENPLELRRSVYGNFYDNQHKFELTDSEDVEEMILNEIEFEEFKISLTQYLPNLNQNQPPAITNGGNGDNIDLKCAFDNMKPLDEVNIKDASEKASLFNFFTKEQEGKEMKNNKSWKDIIAEQKAIEESIQGR